MKNMELRQPLDLLSIEVGDTVSKRNLYDLIQLSKVEGSEYWAGNDVQIGNTPQQGINWLGTLPECRAVIIKTKPGSYDEDGWSSESKESYHYSFKARNGTIAYTEKANQVLIKQPQYGYPVLLFTENKSLWVFEGRFQVSEILDLYVRLARLHGGHGVEEVSQQEMEYLEGGRKYVSHLMVERNSKVVAAAKSRQPWVCEFCLNVFSDRYGVKYIEAHHKVPVSTYSDSYQIKPSDFALLCPNCHTAVHILMKTEGLSYDEIKSRLGATNA
jgi:putative restriction endonuclease